MVLFLKLDLRAGKSNQAWKIRFQSIFSHIFFLLGWKQFQIMIGARHEEIITVQEIIKGNLFNRFF